VPPRVNRRTFYRRRLRAVSPCACPRRTRSSNAILVPGVRGTDLVLFTVVFESAVPDVARVLETFPVPIPGGRPANNNGTHTYSGRVTTILGKCSDRERQQAPRCRTRIIAPTIFKNNPAAAG